MQTTANDAARLRRRRLSSVNGTSHESRLQMCRRMSLSMEVVDLPTVPAREALATLKVLLLSYLEDMEIRLSKLESPLADLHLSETFITKGEHSVEEARLWAKVALEMLHSIRSDISSHFAELPDVPSLADVRSHLPSVSISDVTAYVDDVCSRFTDLDFRSKLSAISSRLRSFQAHLRSLDILPVDFPSLPGGGRLSGIYGSIMSSELVSEFAAEVNAAEEKIEHTARDVARAVRESLDGSRLIKYVDLPPRWRSNRFVSGGYRFIPLERWPLIVMSLFAFHNETLNIHTHLVPFLLWLVHCIPLFNTPRFVDLPEATFAMFALICLFSSAIWHTMSGCAHADGMELCAKIDYVGIGWLISASVGTVVYYGFQCHPMLGNVFLVGCLLTGLAGNIFPFFRWFNDPAYKHLRILFFVSLVPVGAAPLVVLMYLHSPWQVKIFLDPVWPSILSYLIGLIFYATHIPERFLSERFSAYVDWCGCGSHAIWHGFIVLAIKQHRDALTAMRNGITCPAPAF